MKLEQQVVSLELAKQLKELGEHGTRADIVGYEGLYQVSGAGVVFSLARSNGMGSRKQTRPISVYVKRGYEVVALSKNGKTKYLPMHGLVANAFIIKPKGNTVEVNHKDGNKLNNYYWNLEWVTKSENNIHARKMGLLGGEKTNTAKLTEKQVREIRATYPKLNSRELAEKYKVGQNAICKILRKETWRFI